MANSRPPLVLIAGPTASGKSALGTALAERTGGVIVNADASQLYADIPILSAAPEPSERRRADHRLFGTRDGALPCSAAAYAELARAEIEAIHRDGRLPILVGGTGLYIRTLLDGIAPVPPIDPAIRDQVRGASTAENHALLVGLDPVSAARLAPGDSARIARALEVVRSTGRTIGQWQARREGGIAERVALRPIILLPPRDWLVERIEARFAAMIAAGALDEVRALAARHLDPSLPVMRAIGVRELLALDREGGTREAAIAAAVQATRRYAKRQYTWFAHQPPADWPRFDTPLDSPGAMGRALALLDPAG
ncbi:tRNA (adenosine(37)-N6)-dimethylallyltransferase MiaA [Sphingomonas sp. ASV193]|uniref:tRNA (adenosine(37)-N6)-dimethylallyltransferase MiaA n=1 Tax=Sphingomonas sp. ASV193 TaxID=3144405 RepID=UPI0032E90309